MGATEEQMQHLSDAHVSHVSYVLILYSIAFLLFLCKALPYFRFEAFLTITSCQYASTSVRCSRMASR